MAFLSRLADINEAIGRAATRLDQKAGQQMVDRLHLSNKGIGKLFFHKVKINISKLGNPKYVKRLYNLGFTPAQIEHFSKFPADISISIPVPSALAPISNPTQAALPYIGAFTISDMYGLSRRNARDKQYLGKLRKYFTKLNRYEAKGKDGI